jgi:ubiquinone/menaquinone biosynthesis C-methylase UbiE
LFARLMVRLRRKEPREITAHRRELLGGLSGHVLDVGAGDRPNFPLFPRSVTKVIAIEPEPVLRSKALERAGALQAPIDVVDALADHLPLGNGEADAAVVALVLCSVPDQHAALRELHRVVKPGGELRFYEHIASRRPGLLRV